MNKKNDETKKNTIKQKITSCIFGENCAYGGFEDGLICCWNLKVLLNLLVSLKFFRKSLENYCTSWKAIQIKLLIWQELALGPYFLLVMTKPSSYGIPWYYIEISNLKTNEIYNRMGTWNQNTLFILSLMPYTSRVKQYMQSEIILISFE